MECLFAWAGLPLYIITAISPSMCLLYPMCLFPLCLLLLNISVIGHCGLLRGPGILECHGQLPQLQSQLPPAQDSSWPPRMLALLQPLCAEACHVYPVQHSWDHQILMHVLIECSCMSKLVAHLNSKWTVQSCMKWSGSHAWIQWSRVTWLCSHAWANGASWTNGMPTCELIGCSSMN